MSLRGKLAVLFEVKQVLLENDIQYFMNVKSALKHMRKFWRVLSTTRYLCGQVDGNGVHTSFTAKRLEKHVHGFVNAWNNAFRLGTQLSLRLTS